MSTQPFLTLQHQNTEKWLRQRKKGIVV